MIIIRIIIKKIITTITTLMTAKIIIIIIIIMMIIIIAIIVIICICFTCICTLKPLLRRHIDIKNSDLETSLRRSCCNTLTFATLLQRGLTLGPFFHESASCVLEVCNIKTLAHLW